MFDLGAPPYYPGDDCGAWAGVLRSRRWLWHRGHDRLAHHDRLSQVIFLSRKIHQNFSRTLNLTFERMPTHELISENGRVVLSGLKYLKSNSVNKQWAKSFSFLWSDAFQPASGFHANATSDAYRSSIPWFSNWMNILLNWIFRENRLLNMFLNLIFLKKLILNILLN